MPGPLFVIIRRNCILYRQSDWNTGAGGGEFGMPSVFRVQAARQESAVRFVSVSGFLLRFSSVSSVNRE